MANKTDRILSYLPGTFRVPDATTGQPSALRAVAGAIGSELQQGENFLAAVMLAHWVDTADRNAPAIEDLGKIAALYGLQPQTEEELEEFRRHLKRYVRTFLEGTVTVQGLFRITAEALGLTIADDYEDIDSWWRRPSPELVEQAPDADDAALLVLGLPFAESRGQAARPARLTGTPDLSGGVELASDSVLYLQVDDAETRTVALVPAGSDPAGITLAQLVERINAAFADRFDLPVASAEQGHLVITSPSRGAASRLEFEEGTGEAGDRILGLRPLTYFGQAARGAAIVGSVDLQGDLDLRETRYLRLAVDGAAPVEIDVGGDTPGHRTVLEVRDAINAELGFPAASLVEKNGGRFLRLASQSTGHLSSLAFIAAPAQDAAERLFGPHAPVILGSDETAAEVYSLEFPPEGVDLHLRYNLRLSMDDSLPLTIHCAGLRPTETLPTEIANAVNAAFESSLGGPIARVAGRRLRLASPSAGRFSQIRFETPAEADATEILFGLPPRTRHGSAPSSARIVGRVEIDEADVSVRHLLSIRVDGGPPQQVDLRLGVANPRKAILRDLVEAIESQMGPDTATDDGQHLILASPSVGAGSRLDLLPATVETRRHYVNRAMITGEAADAVFGFPAALVRGQAATHARLAGTPDLSHGVDLRDKRYLRLAVDDSPFLDIDCAGPRPRATLLEEIVTAINASFSELLDTDVAFGDGRRLILASSGAGLASRLRFEAPTAQDASSALLGLSPETRFGTAATGVVLTGLGNLEDGVDLPAHAALKIGIDGADPVAVPLTAADPAHLSLPALVAAISGVLGSGIASHDGQHLILTSGKEGKAARIELAKPAGFDATPAVFGLPAPRLYQGRDAKAAILTGRIELADIQDLSVQRFLRIGVDGAAPVDVDCAGRDPAKTKPDEIVARINAALKQDIAFEQGDFLELRSPSAGISSRLVLEHHTGADARTLLFGAVPDETTGVDPVPAVITGSLSLNSPADLSQRSVLRIAVDGGRPRDIDVKGAQPKSSFLEEIVTAINAVFPGLAASFDQDQLRLTSPTAGPESSVAVLPLRVLELIEYLPEASGTGPRELVHGTAFNVDNRGVGETLARLRLDAPRGAPGPTLVNEATGRRLHLALTLRPGEAVEIHADPRRGLVADRIGRDGAARPVPPEQIVTGPLAGRAEVPMPVAARPWLLTGSSAGAARLLLDNPLAPRLVEVHSFVSTPAQAPITVRVVEAALADLPAATDDGDSAWLVGRLAKSGQDYRLLGRGGSAARVRNGIAAGIDAYLGKVVAAEGPYFAAEPPETLPLLIVEAVDCLFDVTLSGDGQVESWANVTLGGPDDDPRDLVWQMNAGPQPSRLARALVLEKAEVLRLPRGRSRFRYLDCLADRFNACVFGSVGGDGRERFPGGAHFAGGVCRVRARFDLCRFDDAPPESESCVYGSAEAAADPPVTLAMSWEDHRPGTLEVRLPRDLPARFGGRFNEDRFSRRSDLPELYQRVVTEPAPEQEPNHIVSRLNAESELVIAQVVPNVPLGWSPQVIPFRKPRRLTLGSEETPARLYLQDPDVRGFIELRAGRQGREREGEWGNGIAVAVRKSGPALYDLTLTYEGARFDSARERVAGPELPALVLNILEPAPVGVRLAKAAGIRARVTRAGVEDQPI